MKKFKISKRLKFADKKIKYGLALRALEKIFSKPDVWHNGKLLNNSIEAASQMKSDLWSPVRLNALFGIPKHLVSGNDLVKPAN